MKLFILIIFSFPPYSWCLLSSCLLAHCFLNRLINRTPLSSHFADQPLPAFRQPVQAHHLLLSILSTLPNYRCAKIRITRRSARTGTGLKKAVFIHITVHFTLCELFPVFWQFQHLAARIARLSEQHGRRRLQRLDHFAFYPYGGFFAPF